jgi:hypothetical protein
MAKPISLDEIIRAIGDLEPRLRTTRMGLDLTEQEILMVLMVEENLKENIAELKRENVVVMATEFRKATEDLLKAAQRMAFLKIKKQTYEKALADQAHLLNFLKQKYATELERIQKNVIRIKFGKKDGR